ncbi:MAG: hypothetical protein ACXQTS_04995 [Candidatus Methanospirareceae archaeon]
MPCIVEGNVTINGEVAPVGTVITAKIDDEVRGTFEVIEAGKYFILIGGDTEDVGKTITFFVNNIMAKETVKWRPGATYNFCSNTTFNY